MAFQVNIKEKAHALILVFRLPIKKCIKMTFLIADILFSRSSTLEDIYRHYENLAGAEDAPVGQSVPPNDGEVTGYAVVGSKVASTSYGVPDYGSSHPTYLSHDSHDSHDAPEIHEYEEVDEKGMKLKELFHLALTAIAFLAFSMFIVEVLMCVMGAEVVINPLRNKGMYSQN